MFLDIENLSHYLLSRGTLDADAIVAGPLVIQQAGRRNRNYKVLRGARPGLFVKQVPVVVTETVASILQEATFYQLAYECEAFQNLRPHLLELHDYDGRIHAITLSLIAECENLTQAHLRMGSMPEDLARSIGQVLGSAHLAGTRFIAGGGQAAKVFAYERPWIFDVASNAETVFGANPSGGTQQLVHRLRQAPRLVSALAQLGQGWRTISLRHGDIKWDNFLVRTDLPIDDAAAVLLVDWELSDLGDPAWDVGAMLASFIQFWVATMSPDASALDDSQMVLQAPHKLTDFWPAIAAFWLSYADTVGLSGPTAAAELHRHIQFAGARLALTAFEVAHPMPNISRTVETFLRMASDILADPEQACAKLFGLDSVLQQLRGAAAAPAPVQEVRP